MNFWHSSFIADVTDKKGSETFIKLFMSFVWGNKYFIKEVIKFA